MLDETTLRSRLAATCLAGRGVEVVRCYATIDSTNNAALAEARGRPPEGGLLVVARRQTAGRGQRGSRWWSGEGSLMFSLLTPQLDLPGGAKGRAALVVGAAVCSAIEQLMPRLPGLRLKWPNDVYLAGKKLSGILIESSAERPRRLVIGVGVNAANRLVDAPAEVRAAATSLADNVTEPVDLAELLVACVEQIDGLLGRLTRGDKTLGRVWATRSLLDGRRVTVDAAGGRIEGVCVGIDMHGRLGVETESGLRWLVSGTVLDWD